MRRARPLLPVTLALALAAIPAALAAPGCQGNVAENPCKDVPPGGCPLSHGYACDDPTCQAAYACNPDGTWTLDHVCPAPDASTDASGIDADAAKPDASEHRFDASGIDAPPGSSGGPGCAALQPPDCPLSTALACPNGCCGCEDLFVCTNGGWNAWGTCDYDAGIVPR